MYYDLHIHSKNSGGEDEFSSIVEMAKKIGIDGIGLVTEPDNLTWGSDDQIDIVKAVMIKPKNTSELRDMVSILRNKAELIIVSGGDYEINRAASENSLVDVIAYPEFNRKDSGMDHICMRAAHDNDVAIEINFREVLESHDWQRSKILSFMRRNIMLAKKYDVKVVVTSGSFSRWNMRFPRDMASLLNLLGADISEAVSSISTIPSEIVESNRKKLANKKWEGVEVAE